MIITTLKVFIATKYITHFFDTLYVTERLSSCKTSLFGLATNMVAQSHNEQELDKKNVFSSFTHSSDWDGWLDDLLFYNFFNSISIIAG